MVPGVVPPQVQDFTHLPAELEEVRFLLAHFSSLTGSLCMAEQPSGSISHSSQFAVSHKLVEGTLYPTIQIINGAVEQT